MRSGDRIAVVAVGGNSLIVDAMRESIPDQYEAVVKSIECIADMVERGWRIAIVHGNGPQVGYALRRNELSMPEVPPMPMDYADADTQGVIGYMFQRALTNEFAQRGLLHGAVTVVTQVQVDAEDPAMDAPTKPIGSFMSEAEAQEVARQDGWDVREDAGRGWRRLAASPRPRRIIELDAIRTLLARGFVVVCCGGGGIPVVDDGDYGLVGVRAVIDKDLTASMLARELDAELLAISTGVERIALGFGTPQERPLDSITSAELRRHQADGEFPAGSMGPKVEAVLEYLAAGGRRALVTDPDHLMRAVDGCAGTEILA